MRVRNDGSSQRIASLNHQRRLQQVRQQDDFLSAGGQALQGDVLTALGW